MRVRSKSQMFFIITPLIEELLKEQKCFEFVICNLINLLFLHLCVKLELEEKQSHKVVTVMSIEFDLLLLVSLQLLKTSFQSLLFLSKSYWEKQICFVLLVCNQVNFRSSLYSSKLEGPKRSQSHTVAWI